MTFSNDSDYISFRHHTYKRDGKAVELSEVGPRFEMKGMPGQIVISSARSRSRWRGRAGVAGVDW
jgi:U3 small nucleolar ribonucleoprotein protein IMP4